MDIRLVILSCVILGLLASCVEGTRSAKGFSLPDGDVSDGKVVFVELQCNSCHSIGDVDQHEIENNNISVQLGGQVRTIKTYGELVTSIINPSHRIAKGYAESTVLVDGQSRMPNYNEVMTVNQLIDLVSFLQSEYSLRPYDPTDYPTYYP